MESLEDWRSKLSPWLEMLQGKFVLEMEPLPSKERVNDVWITLEGLQPVDMLPEPWARIEEGLELLDLLARVEPEVGWSLVLELTTADRVFEINEDEHFSYDKRPPRYVVELFCDTVAVDPTRAFDALNRLIGVGDQPPSTENFTSVKKELEDTWQQRNGGRRFDRQRDGRIELRLAVTLDWNFTGNAVMFMITRIRDLARANRAVMPEQESQSDFAREALEAGMVETERIQLQQRKAVFCFEQIDVDLAEHVATNNILCALLEISEAHALPLRRLRLQHLLTSRLHFSVGGSFFLRMVSDQRGLKDLALDGGQFDPVAVSGICSAVAASSCLTRFSFGRLIQQVAERPQNLVGYSTWWPWLAYALFSTDATHHIEAIKLDVYDLRSQDVQQMREVVKHPNPAAYVCALSEPDPKSPVLVAPPTGVILKPEGRVAMGHRIIIAHPEDHADTGVAHVTIEVPQRIVRDNKEEDFLEILFPGTGVAWVDRADVVEVIPFPEGERPPTKSLSLNDISKESSSAVVELLQLVGGSLTALSLQSFDTLDEAFMVSVCGLCPNITRLAIAGSVQNLNWLLSLSTNGSRCFNIRSFQLSGEVMDHNSFLAFFDALGDNDHAISKNLREFHHTASWNVDFPATRINEVGDNWLKMLDKNHRLERSEFVDHFEKADFLDKLSDHDREMIFVPETLAFMSVVTATTRTGKRPTLSARYRMSSESVYNILDLAGYPLRRICG